MDIINHTKPVFIIVDNDKLVHQIINQSGKCVVAGNQYRDVDIYGQLFFAVLKTTAGSKKR